MDQTLRDRAKGYQVVLNGKTLEVSELTQEQAVEALMNAIDVVTDIEETLGDASARVETWAAKGK